MQISVFGFLGDGAGRSPVDAYVEELARARDEGFARMWTAQLPYEPDLLLTLAVALREVPDIHVGTGVLPIQVEHPMAMAQRALTVNLISGGRLTLGLGLSHRTVTERVWGIPWDRPIRRMSEYLDGLLPLLDGRKADPAGETVTTRGSLRTAAPRPAVYIAALGPQMLRLAGRRTRGTVTWMTGPRTLAEHVGPTLRDAAEEAGRPREAVRVVASLPVSVTDQVDRARVGLPFGHTPEDHARTAPSCAHTHPTSTADHPEPTSTPAQPIVNRARCSVRDGRWAPQHSTTCRYQELAADPSSSAPK